MADEYHTPVLAEEALRFLNPVSSGIYVDGTLGGGGHTERMLMMSAPAGKVIAFDRDSDAITYAKKRLAPFVDRVLYCNENFSSLENVLRNLGIEQVQGILLDLGVSSRQINERERGFSFQEQARIDMRMDKRQQHDGWTVVNTYTVGQLEEIFRVYGEEHQSRRIAKKIVSARERKPIESTDELSTVVESVVGGRFFKKSLARVFQAIRIEVNRELQHLQLVLSKSINVMETGARIVVLSYHSLEDRIVKDFFREESKTSEPSGNKLIPDKQLQPRLRLLTKKPIEATEAEITANPRARSAKLRAAERI
jgi:16S rRNA (cytosine1402-N4)-methyltransferase